MLDQVDQSQQSAAMLGNNPFSITSGSQTITVTEENHGRSSW